MKRHIAALLALTLLLSACGGGRASSMKLVRTEGTVGVSDERGQDIQVREALKLYSGYGVDTQAVSYAWIDLDQVKLAKLDADSEIQIQSDGKALEIVLDHGSIFFHVTEPLAEDETMTIRTSNMAVGIRGTCGWVSAEAVYILEGSVTVTDGQRTVTVSAGEMADSALTVSPFSSGDIPSFVRDEITEPLEALIEQAAGFDPLAEDTLVLTLPVTSKEISDSWLDGYTTIIVRSGSESVLRGTNDYYLLVEEGRRLVLEEGVQLEIEETSLGHIYGTLEMSGDIVNRGIFSIYENGRIDIGGTFSNEAGGSLINESECAAAGIESAGSFDNSGSMDLLVTQTGGQVSLLSGGYLREIVLRDVLSAYISGGHVERVTQYDSSLTIDNGTVDSLEQHGGHGYISGGQVGLADFFDGDLYVGGTWNDRPAPSVGTLTQAGGSSILSGGSVGSFVMNAGEAYLTETFQTGSISHSGGELVDNRH